MAVPRSRLHAVLLSCARCSRSSARHSAILKERLHTTNRHPFLHPHRRLWSKGQPTCQSWLHLQGHQGHPHHFRWQQIDLRTSSQKAHLTSSSGHQVQSSAAVLDPYQLVQSEMSTLCDSIRHELSINQGELGTIVRYYFDGTGKAFRPMVVMLMAKACNIHHRAEQRLLESQRRIAMITEMLHTATLIHDDVIDASDARRGKDSINHVWGQRKAILSGNYILSALSMVLARIGNPQVVSIMSQVVEDLVRGEFMQLGSKEDENERFSHYLDKTFKKTASMLAASCQSVAVLGDCDDDVSNMAYDYGRNLGIAFQLVDDLLDFVSSEQLMGKPTAADLKLGLATAPVLFAAQQYPELNALIMRRFSQDGDVEMARQMVAKSDGIEQTKLLASKHTQEALRLLQYLNPSTIQHALVTLTQRLLTRQK
ncbi:all trans-polyprenyl-diphosphate synthase PDSS1-like [Babylonia areolata]|uniref:all trans-polyprenyl-diphosphate synthase PDSS1-like n=1 Tax=Babylonia areolata TaxID=304850 RepID=UPI003FD42162